MKKFGVIIFGIVFIAVGIFMLINGNELKKRCTVEATGKVIAITEEQSTDSDGNWTYTYYPVIEYNAENRTISVQSKTGSNPSKYNTGDSVDILYNPENVEEFIVKGDNSSNIIGIVFIVAGVLVVGIGVKNIIFG